MKYIQSVKEECHEMFVMVLNERVKDFPSAILQVK